MLQILGKAKITPTTTKQVEEWFYIFYLCMITQLLSHILRKARNMLSKITKKGWRMILHIGSQYDNAIFVAYLEESEKWATSINQRGWRMILSYNLSQKSFIIPVLLTFFIWGWYWNLNRDRSLITYRIFPHYRLPLPPCNQE